MQELSDFKDEMNFNPLIKVYLLNLEQFPDKNKDLCTFRVF